MLGRRNSNEISFLTLNFCDCLFQISAMLKTLRKCPSAECRHLVALTLGSLGAVDVGRAALSPSIGQAKKIEEMVFVDSGKTVCIVLF